MPSSPASHSRKILLLPATCFAVLVGLALALERWPTRGLDGYATRAKPELILGQDRITTRNAEFLREGLLEMSHRFCEPEQLAAASPAAVALYGQPCPAPDAALLAREMPPSTALLPPAGTVEPMEAVVVSIVCRGDHLFDPHHGIVANPMNMGRNSERPAWLSARLGADLLVESPIGLRIHGGSSRAGPSKSFSLVFREKFGGHAKCAPGLFFGADTPAANHLVLLNATHPSRFNAALATEIAARLGCNTSRLAPAVVFLNGTQIKAPFFLYQHQSPEFVKQRFGLEEVDWERLKANRERDNPRYVNWRQWIRKDRFPTLLSEEAARYDIADLSAWALAISFTSTADNNQGAYFRDRSKPESVWRSLAWDMDCAFVDELHQPLHGPYMNVQDPIKTLLGDRARLFHRLLERTPEYRDQFRRFAHEALTRKLPKAELMALVDRYQKLAQSHPTASPDLLHVMQDTRSFLATRHEVYLAYLDRCLSEFEKAGLALESAGAN
jgi:hypothetical protein